MNYYQVNEVGDMIFSTAYPNPSLSQLIDDYKTGHYGEDEYGDCKPSTCPVCDEETYELFYNNYTDEIVGCQNCVSLKYTNEI